jgi:hypothetical protein
MGSKTVSVSTVLQSAAMSAAVVGRSSELSDLRIMARLAQIFDADVTFSDPKSNRNKGRTHERPV